MSCGDALRKMCRLGSVTQRTTNGILFASQSAEWPKATSGAPLFYPKGFVRRNQEQRRANDRLGIGNDSPRRAQRFHSHARWLAQSRKARYPEMIDPHIRRNNDCALHGLRTLRLMNCGAREIVLLGKLQLEVSRKAG